MRVLCIDIGIGVSMSLIQVVWQIFAKWNSLIYIDILTSCSLLFQDCLQVLADKTQT